MRDIDTVIRKCVNYIWKEYDKDSFGDTAK